MGSAVSKKQTPGAGVSTAPMGIQGQALRAKPQPQAAKGMPTKAPPVHAARSGGVHATAGGRCSIAVGQGAKPWGEKPPTPQELKRDGMSPCTHARIFGTIIASRRLN